MNSLSTGCTAVDFTFNNFQNSTFSGNGGNGAGSLAGTYLAETPAGTNLSPLTNPDTLLFATVRGAANVGTNGDNNDSMNNFTSNHNQAAVSDVINFNVSPAVGGDSSAYLTSILLTIEDPQISGAGTGSLKLNICAGNGITGVAATNTAGACTTAGGSYFSTTLNLSTASSLSTTLNVTGFQTSLDLSSVITLTNANGSGNTSGFDAFSLTFDEAVPEPSTFVLLSIPLVGLIVIRRRRRA